MEVDLSSAREEAGRREREWGEEKERREATELGLNQQVSQLQASLSAVKKEKAEVGVNALLILTIYYVGREMVKTREENVLQFHSPTVV